MGIVGDMGVCYNSYYNLIISKSMEKNNYAIPIAIIVAGLLIAGAVLYGGSGSRSLFGEPNDTADSPSAQPPPRVPGASSLTPLVP